jgi:hypothetical protein
MNRLGAWLKDIAYGCWTVFVVVSFLNFFLMLIYGPLWMLGLYLRLVGEDR